MITVPKRIVREQYEILKQEYLSYCNPGLVVDQDALVEALQKKVIKTAALDVTYPEPLPR